MNLPQIKRHTSCAPEWLNPAFSLEPFPERIKKAGYINQALYLNDGTSQNINATWYTLEVLPDKLIWIMYGSKQNSLNAYKILADLARRKVEYIICLGEPSLTIKHFFSPLVTMLWQAENMEHAVAVAASLSKPGYTVIYSPAAVPFFDHSAEFDKNVLHLPHLKP